MSEIVKKVLESGLIDRSMVELLEQWGNLPDGSSEVVNDEKLVGATKDQLMKLANELVEAVDREHVMRETNLDLNRLRWPIKINIFKKSKFGILNDAVAYMVSGLVDRMGRYYFRIQDVDKKWFVPGYVFEIQSEVADRTYETILEVDVLSFGEQPVCIQISTQRA